MSRLGSCLFLKLLLVLPIVAWADEPRIWTSNDGVTISAKLKSVQNNQVVLELADGKTATVPLTRLSAADLTYLRQLKTPVWPAQVEVASRALDVKILEENAAEKRYIYRSELFEFISQDKLSVSVMKELARAFEATQALIKALPWSIDPAPPEDLSYYQAKFYATRRNYILAGGPENSGGVYFSKDRTFLVPFESLGLELRGKTWYKNESYRNDTLVHEITHQTMHESLPFMPMWVIEGTAEYVKMLPYNAGRFLTGAHERGIKDYIKLYKDNYGFSVSDTFNLLNLMKTLRVDWQKQSLESPESIHRLYFNSTLLVYYFCHLDGTGDGSRFIQYMNSVKKAREAWKDFFQNPQVKLQPDGSFTYPANLPLPPQEHSETYGISQLDILLNGRDASQLDEEIKAAFRKIGVR